MTKHRKILNIIYNIRESHSSMVDIFTKGSCINMFLILHSIFPEAIPYSNNDHIVTKIDDRLYDINGVVLNTDNYIPYSSYYNKKTFNRQFKSIYTNELKLKNERHL